MKKPVFTWAVLFAGSAFLQGTVANAIPVRDEGDLGEIRYSVLDIVAFQERYGNGWVALDGRSVTNEDDIKKEGLWTKSNLPDARGRYLRIANLGRNSDSGDPAGDLEAGTEQGDATAVNDLTINDPGHSHGVPQLWSGNSADQNQHWTVCGFPEQTDGQYGVGTEQSKTGITLKSNSQETRPRSVVVHAYIKIRYHQGETLQSKKLNAGILETIRRIISKMLGGLDEKASKAWFDGAQD